MKFYTLVKEFKKRWDEAETLKEMAKIRDEFFSLPFNYRELESGWDYISLGERFINRSELTFEDIKEKRKQGKTYKQIAKEFGCSPSKIQYIVKRKRREGLYEN